MPMSKRVCLVGLFAVLIAFLSLTSCATLALRPFNPHSHGNVYAEWAPHRDAGEWWYVTGVLKNGAGDLWLYQFTIFHEAKAFEQGYLLDLALSDYQTGQHIFEEYGTTNPRTAYARNGSIIYGGSSITLTTHKISVVAKGKRLSFSFTLIPEKPPVWEANDGVEALGTPGKSDQMSYYYSFTRLRTFGTISYENESGKRVERRLNGSSWIDRQWGHFGHSGWDWFSIRLFDGTDVMLYAFPSTGFREGTIVGPRGKSQTIRNFTYQTETWQTHDGSRYGLKWGVDIPALHRQLRIVALARNNFNPNRLVTYWEGLCKVYNRKGALVGYAVEETPASAHRLTR